MQTSDQKKLEEAITWEQDKDLGTRQRPGNKAKTWKQGKDLGTRWEQG